MTKLSRTEAIDRIARADLAQLSTDARGAMLESMMTEAWTEHASWPSMPREVKRDFKREILSQPASWAGYVQPLLLKVRARYASATDAYLTSRLASLGARR
jgi:hypothetical protein